jgi:O-antigen ligase
VAALAEAALAGGYCDGGAGGIKWFATGGPRIALTQRVVEVTMHNPVTGLGPASYRLYAGAQPLRYEHVTWFNPRVSSHNNYIDLFAHTGIVGVALFFWFVFEIGRLGLQLHRQCKEGFRSAYTSGMLAAGIASLLLMTFADWILPFVYNIGFPGFQASILAWLYLGGLVSLQNLEG